MIDISTYLRLDKHQFSEKYYEIFQNIPTVIDLKNRRKNKQQTFSVSCDVAQNVAELKNNDNISNVNCWQNHLFLATPNFSRSVSPEYET